MAKEVEYKLSVPGPARLQELLHAPELAALAQGTPEDTAMQTVYYDTPERSLSARRWMLRRRMENTRSVVCLKTPTNDAHTRGEYELEAQAPDAAARQALVQAGAPQELLALCAQAEPQPVCGAAFTRRHVLLRFSDGSSAELAADCGVLYGAQTRQEFCELELELREGEAAQMQALVRLLCARYGLHEEPRSKFARARALP